MYMYKLSQVNVYVCTLHLCMYVNIYNNYIHYAIIYMYVVLHVYAHTYRNIHTCYIVYIRFLVRVSYLEIYNEGVRDLLSKNTKAKLEVRERSDIGVYVKDLTSFVVKNVDEMLKLMLVGSKNSK